jgi:hypothetical protein
MSASPDPAANRLIEPRDAVVYSSRKHGSDPVEETE